MIGLQAVEILLTRWSATWPSSWARTATFSGHITHPGAATGTSSGAEHLAVTRGYYRTLSPVTALPIIIRWISDVPSKMVKILASRCMRSTG